MATCSWCRLHRADHVPDPDCWLGIGSIALALFLVLLIVAWCSPSLVQLDRRARRLPAAARLVRLAPLISAIGMSIFLSNFVQVAQGPRNKPLPPIITGEYRVDVERAATTSTSPTSRSSSGSSPLVLMVGLLVAGREDPRSAARSAPASRTRRWRRCSASTSTAPSRSPS